MRCCAGPAQYRSNPGHTCRKPVDIADYTAPAREHELQIIQIKESISLERSSSLKRNMSRGNSLSDELELTR